MVCWDRVPGIVTIAAADVDVGYLINDVLLAAGAACVIVEDYPRSKRSRFPYRRTREQ